MRRFLVFLVLVILFLNIGVKFVYQESYTNVVGYGMVEGELLNPKGVAVDEDGNIYVVDSGNSRIQVFDKDGNYKFMFGGKGSKDFQFMMPVGIAVFKNRVFITDSYSNNPLSNKVVVFDKQGRFLYSFGELGSEGGNFINPTGIYCSDSGYLYVCDQGNKRIEKFTLDGVFISSFGSEYLKNPYGIFIKGSKIYITDISEKKIFIFDENSQKLISKIDNKKVLSPRGICVDSEEDIYVVDSANYSIFKFNSDGDCIKTIGRYGIYKGKFIKPDSIAIFKNHLIVTDETLSRIQAFSLSGNFEWEVKSVFFKSENMSGPSDFYLDKSNIVICDSRNWRILYLNKKGEFVREIIDIKNSPFEFPKEPEENVKDQTPFLKHPISVNPINNNLLIGDYGNFLWEMTEAGLKPSSFFRFILLDSSGNYINSFGDLENYPTVYDFCVDDRKNLIYALTSHSLIILDLKGRIKRQVNFQKYDLFSPEQINLYNNKLYIVFSFSCKIAVFSKEGKLLKLIGGRGKGDGQFMSPQGFFIDEKGNIYVADTENSRIQVLDSKGNFLYSIGRWGTSEGQFIHPIRVFVKDKEILVLDDYTNKISIFDMDSKEFKNQIGGFSLKDEQLVFPTSCDVFSSGEIVALDGLVGTIHIFDKNGDIKFKFGSSGDISERFSSNNFFGYMGKITVDKNDNIYVTSVYEDGIYIYDKFGHLVDIICGEFLNLKSPFGITVDEEGKIYVTDITNNSVSILEKIGDLWFNVFTFGKYGRGEGELDYPQGISLDEDGNIYVADSGNSRIQVFNKKGEFLRQISIPCGFSEISYTPSDVCIYNDLIFVSNTCKSNILIFDLEGNIVKTIGEKGGPGSNYSDFHGVKHYYQEFKKFLYPMGISVKNGDLLVADTGNSRIQVIQVKNLYDNNPPQIAITREIPNLIADTSVNIYLKAIDDVSSPDKIQLFVKIDDNEWKEFNSNPLSLNNLSEGKHSVLIKALDEAGNESEPLKIEFIVDTTPPNIEITSPEDNFYTNEETLNIKGSVSDSLSGVDKLIVNGEEVNIKDNGIFEKEITLSEGENKIKIKAYDKAGNKQEKTLTVYLDKTPPELSVNIPDEVNDPDLTITGSVKDNLSGIKYLKINEEDITISSDGSFSYTITLTEGENTITFELEDKAGNKTTETFTVNYIKRIILKLKIGSKTMYINDEPKEIDVPPTIVEGRTLLPIRWVAEPLGADVSWDGEERKVTVSLNNIAIELWIGKSTARVNGIEKPIDPNNPKVVPMILNGRTMLPVRFVAENLGADVLWDGTTKTVTIIYPKE